MDIPLGDFVKYLLVIFQKNSTEIWFRDHTPWHQTFYGLKRYSNAKGKPKFFQNLQFDWDGRYPQSQELNDFLSSLRITGSVTTASPQYRKYSLEKETAELWSKKFETLGDETKEFLNFAAFIFMEEVRVIQKNAFALKNASF